MSVAALRKWTEMQLADTVKYIVKRAIEIDQIRLRAPRFLPALETTFGNLDPLYRGAGEGAREQPAGQARDTPLAPAGYLGLSDVPLAAVLGEEAGDENRGAKNANENAAAAAGSADGGDDDGAYDAASPGKKDRWFADGDAHLSTVGSSEVHMRRFDSDSAFHRRAIGAVRIEAKPSVVYGILTDYESYPEFVPDLAFLELVRVPQARAASRAERARAVAAFARAALYHSLEDAVTFDLVRKDDQREVRFRVVEAFAGASAPAPGDRINRITQGKWLVLPCPDTEDATILKFAVEGRAPRRRATRAVGFWQNYASFSYWDASLDAGEPLSERAVFDGVLRMLLSVREHSETVAALLSASERDTRLDRNAFLAPSDSKTLSRLSASDPMVSIESQLRELGYGGDSRSMPRRVELRARRAGARARDRGERRVRGGCGAARPDRRWAETARVLERNRKRRKRGSSLRRRARTRAGRDAEPPAARGARPVRHRARAGEARRRGGDREENRTRGAQVPRAAQSQGQEVTRFVFSSRKEEISFSQNVHEVTNAPHSTASQVFPARGVRCSRADLERASRRAPWRVRAPGRRVGYGVSSGGTPSTLC